MDKDRLLCITTMAEKFDINRYDLFVYLDTTFYNSEFSDEIQKDMFDCLTYVNTHLSYFLIELIYELSLRTHIFYFVDYEEANTFLYETLSSITKIS
jgi:hypothetical protein